MQSFEEAHGQPTAKVNDVMEFLGMARGTIYQMIARGEFDVIHIGRAIRIVPSSVDAFVRANLTSATLNTNIQDRSASVAPD